MHRLQPFLHRRTAQVVAAALAVAAAAASVGMIVPNGILPPTQ